MTAIPAAIAGGASLIGGLMQSQQQQSQSAAQMAFQERMSDTAYQRATADMRMAGINPILAFSQGGATTPSGAQATIPNVVGPAVSSALQARQLSAQMEQMDKQNDLLHAQLNTQNALTTKAYSDTNQNIASTNLLNTNNILAQANIPGAQRQAAIDAGSGGGILNMLERWSKTAAGPIVGAGVGQILRKALSGGVSEGIRVGGKLFPLAE